MIRNYENPENTILLIDSTSVTVPVKVFTSSTTGGPIGGGVTGRQNAVTVNIYVVRSGKTAGSGNLIVSNLTVPAGETVFFSEERLVFDSGDELWVGTSAAARLSVTVSALAV